MVLPCNQQLPASSGVADATQKQTYLVRLGIIAGQSSKLDTPVNSSERPEVSASKNGI